MILQLTVVTGPDQGRSFPLIAGETLQVGRSPATLTKLTDPTVSRVHCAVDFDGHRVVLVNLSSSGTRVNGQTVVEQELQHGDTVKVGNSELRLRDLESADATTIIQLPGNARTPRPTASSASAAALAGQTLSNYLLEAVIARGNSGVVYKAHDTTTGQTVALKVLQPEFTQNEEEMQRFIRGMKAALPLRHPNLITLLKAGKTGAFCWMAMDYIDGESLTEVIQRVGVAGMLDWRVAFRVTVHIARVLDYAHGLSIAHRNVTPQNILLRARDQTALLGDLLLAKTRLAMQARPVTRPGGLVGDIAYMAPERTRGEEADARSDLYGLGATVYALVVGRPPFGGALPELIVRIRSTEPEEPKKYQPAMPDTFQATILKLLAKRPEERFQTAKELLVELDRVERLAGASN